jgi:hypothetical protein
MKLRRAFTFFAILAIVALVQMAFAGSEPLAGSEPMDAMNGIRKFGREFHHDPDRVGLYFSGYPFRI